MFSNYLCLRSLVPQRLRMRKGFLLERTLQVGCIVPPLEIPNSQKHNKGPEKSCS